MSSTLSNPPPYEQNLQSAPSRKEPKDKLPAYRPTEQPASERWFWRGFLFAPLWMIGIRYLWKRRTTTVSTAEDHGCMTIEEAETGHIKRQLFREEEVLWAMRCLNAFGAFTLSLGLLLVILHQQGAFS